MRHDLDAEELSQILLAVANFLYIKSISGTPDEKKMAEELADLVYELAK